MLTYSACDSLTVISREKEGGWKPTHSPMGPILQIDGPETL